MPNRTFRAVAEVFIVAFFVVAISLPLALLLVRGAGAPAWENRRLAELPRRPAGLIEAFHLPRMLSEYFKDHFGLRAELIRWQALARVKLLGSSSSSDVILGKGGWLFYSGEQMTELYSRARPFTDEELARWKSYLESVRDESKRFDAPFVLIIVPEKQTIYPEEMPGGVVRMPKASRLDQLFKYLKESSDIRVVDLRPALSESKSSAQIYFKTDTHWNDLGGFVAYQSIVDELGKDFDGMQPLSLSDCDKSDTLSTGGDLAGLLGLYDVLTENRYHLQPKLPRARFDGNCFDRGRCSSRIEGSSLPRLYMQRDSFSDYLIPFLAEHFSQGIYVWDVKPIWYPELFEAEQPNVVLIEMTERSLMVPPPEVLPAHAGR